MISWMQHNKKYLIITLWISVITFVGAGFVGWGSYSYGSKSRAIAKIGDVEIKLSEFQITYSNLYGYYSQMFGGNFDESMAKKLRLQESAFNILKREALLINLANEYGLSVLDEEIAKNIYQNHNFFKDGKFDRQQYELILQNSGLTPKEYEARLYKVILISKLQELLKMPTTPFEEEVISSLLKLKDKIELKILTTSDVNVTLSNDEVKAYWELNKNQYLSDELYTISYIETPLVDKLYTEDEIQNFYNTHALEYNDKLENVKSQVIEDMLKKESKKSAMKDYIAFKKGTYTGNVQTTTVGEINLLLSSEDLNELKKLKVSGVMKPKYSNGVFITAKLDKIQPPQIQPFDEVKEIVMEELSQQKREEKILEIAKNSYQKFEGEVIGYVGINDADKISTLQLQEANQLLTTIFTQSVESGFVKLGSKVAMYRVLEQKSDDDNNSDNISDATKGLKEKILDDNLIKKLEYYYSIETYFKG